MTNFTLLYKKSGLKSAWKALKNKERINVQSRNYVNVPQDLCYLAVVINIQTDSQNHQEILLYRNMYLFFKSFL